MHAWAYDCIFRLLWHSLIGFFAKHRSLRAYVVFFTLFQFCPELGQNWRTCTTLKHPNLIIAQRLVLYTTRSDQISQKSEISPSMFEIGKWWSNNVSAIGFGSSQISGKLASREIDLYKSGCRYLGSKNRWLEIPPKLATRSEIRAVPLRHAKRVCDQRTLT